MQTRIIGGDDMTCKDCIHENVCSALIEKGLPWVEKEYPADVFCTAFRNKSLVIELPCKIGEPIYRVCSPRGTYHKPYVRKFKLTYKTLKSTIEDFGKTVFLTRAEAERVANGREKAD